MLASNQPAISLLRSVHRTPASQYQGDLVRVEFALTKLANLLALTHRLLAGLTRHSHRRPTDRSYTVAPAEITRPTRSS